MNLDVLGILTAAATVATAYFLWREREDRKQRQAIEADRLLVEAEVQLVNPGSPSFGCAVAVTMTNRSEQHAVELRGWQVETRTVSGGQGGFPGAERVTIGPHDSLSRLHQLPTDTADVVAVYAVDVNSRKWSARAIKGRELLSVK